MGVVIYTIPKSGTHFMSDIISLMINPKTNIYNKNKMYKFVPHIKKIDKSKVFFSTHPKYIKLEKLIEKKYKLIMMIRNPLDLCISKYFFFEKRKPKKKRQSIFQYIKNNVEKESKKVWNFYNNYIKNKESAILVKYEDLILDLDTSLEIVHEYLKNYKQIKKEINYELIKEKINFDKVKKEEKKNGIYKVGRIQNSLFHRSGKVGQVKDHLNQNQINEIMESIPKYIYEIYPEKLYL